MAAIDILLSALDERNIARRIGTAHDEARLRFPLRFNTIASFDEFSRVIGDYYNFHYTRVVSRGGSLSPAEAASRAKELLEREYRRHNGNLISAYNDAHDGLRGGLRAVLDRLADAIRAESVERYVRDVFDRVVVPIDWDAKVETIRGLIRHFGGALGPGITSDQAPRFAHDYVNLVRGVVAALQQTSSLFRRL